MKLQVPWIAHNTEIGIMNSLDLLSRDLTLILIAHRLSTLKSCDKIFKIRKWTHTFQLLKLDLSLILTKFFM